jgi:fatty-acid desaturase
MGEKRIYASAKETYLGMERHIFSRFWLTFTHSFGFYGLYLVLIGQVPWSVIVYWAFHGYLLAGLGLTVAGHRYWAHKSFKAKPFLRLVLIYMHTAAGQVE